MDKVICQAYGQAIGKIGPAVAGVRILTADGELIEEFAQSIGNSSTDYANYQAVMLGFQILQDLYGSATTETEVEMCLQNEPVKLQLNNESPVTDPALIPFFMAIHNLQVEHFPHRTYRLVGESDNQLVATLVEKVLDQKA